MKTAFLPFMNTIIKTPQSFEEAIEFLSKSFCSELHDQYEVAISLVQTNYSQISPHQFHQLNNASLYQIFTSAQLKISHEDSLFQIITGLISKDQNRIRLLSTIRYPYVSSHLLIDFFKDFSVKDVDDNLFEAFKERLFSDIAKPNSQILYERFSEIPLFLSRQEINEIFSFLQTYLKSSENPITKNMKKNNPTTKYSIGKI